MSSNNFRYNISQGRRFLFSPAVSPTHCSQDLYDVICRIVELFITDEALLFLYISVMKQCPQKQDFDSKFDTFFQIQRGICSSNEEKINELKELIQKFVAVSGSYDNDKGKIVEYYADQVIKKYYQQKGSALQSTYESEISVEFEEDSATTQPRKVDICSTINSMTGEYFECKCSLNPQSSGDTDKVSKITSVNNILERASSQLDHGLRLRILTFYADDRKIAFYKSIWPDIPVLSAEGFNKIFLYSN